MSSRLEKAKQEAKAKISGTGESKDKFQTFVATTLLEEYAKDFITMLRENIKSKGVVNSGDLESNIRYEIDENGSKMTISMLDYFDFPNIGVRGVKDSKNAPDSPYQFKNYGMNDEGRARIREMITSGKAKVRDTSKTRRPIGLEKKRKSLVDMQTDTLIYMIKKYGIKRTSYFDDAFNTVFFAFKDEMAQAYGEDFLISIELMTKKK
jgi:hypothetical protein